MKNANKIYVILAMLILSVPLFCTPFSPTTESTEAAAPADAPQLFKEGKFNPEFVTEAGDWFEDHIAFRQEMITANTLIQKDLLATSPVSQVVLGKDGWYFYAETLDDYTGKSLLSSRELFAAVHNLQLMQWSANSQNSQFAVLIPPNKNTVYPEKMPDSYSKADEKNLFQLQEALKASGVNVIDVSQPLIGHKEENLYYERDSHWNRKGSLLAYDTLMASLGLNPKPYASMQTRTEGHKGDLDEILLPKAWKPEEEEIVDDNMTYSPRLEGDALMDTWIETENPQGAGSLLMFRDSYGINLIPYLADSFEKGWFSRLEPYNFVQISSLQPQVVIVEKTERRIDQFASQAAIMQMPTVSLAANTAGEQTVLLDFKESGDFMYIHGVVNDEEMAENTNIYLALKDQTGQVRNTYAVFYLCSEESDNEFGLYLPKSVLNDQDSFEILLQSDQQIKSLAGERKTES